MSTFDYNKYMKELKERQARELAEKNQTLKETINSLKNRAVEEVIITFDGSGDSGSIDQIDFIPNDKLTEEDAESFFKNIESWGYAFLDTKSTDWYNNDGGFGTIKLDLKSDTLDYEIHQNYTSSELAESGEKIPFNSSELNDDEDDLDCVVIPKLEEAK